MNFKFVARVLGGHTHVTVYAGKQPGSLGNAGSVTFKNEEWNILEDALARGFAERPDDFVVFLSEQQS